VTEAGPSLRAVESEPHFHDLGGPREGDALVREIVKRDWPRLGYDRQQDLIALGYQELDNMREQYRPNVGTFEGYVRRFLPLRLRKLAKKVMPPEEEVRLEAVEYHGPIPAGRSAAANAAQLGARTKWFGASALDSVIAAHAGEASDPIPPAARAWREAFGRAVARKLEPWARYWLLEVRLGDRQTHLAFSDRGRLREARQMLERLAGAVLGDRGAKLSDRPDEMSGKSALDHDRGILGVNLAAVTKSLAGVNPSTEELAERAREAEERAKRVAPDRERQYEERTFGVVVSGLPDTED
jgi:hypothetical protein